MAQGQERVGPGRRGRTKQKEAHRLFWAVLAAPGIIWLALLFVVPFYAILAIAGGQVDIFGNPVAVWNPLQWSSLNFSAAWRDVAGASAFVGPILLRTNMEAGHSGASGRFDELEEIAMRQAFAIEAVK